MKKIFLILAILIFGFLGGSYSSGSKIMGNEVLPQEIQKEQYIVVCQDEYKENIKTQINTGTAGSSLKMVDDLDNLNVLVLSGTEEDVEKVDNLLGVDYLLPDYITTISGTITEAETGWNHRMNLSVDAWNKDITGKNITIAVLDTGINNHSDLVVTGRYDTIDLANNAYDQNGHGTAVAGVIGAKGNGIGTVGVAPDALIYSVRVLGANGTGNLSELVEGLEYCISNGIDIANASLGINPQDLTASQIAELESYLNQLMLNCYNNNVLVVAGTGNDGNATDNVSFPARSNYSIAVGAVDENKILASFSSTGPSIDYVAPGVSVKTTGSSGNYVYGTGTSFAAPSVSGLAALYMEKYPNISYSDLVSKLDKNAVDLGTTGKDNYYGKGLATYSEKNYDLKFTDFSIANQESKTIDPNTNSIEIMMPYGSDLTNLVASFTTSSTVAAVTINGVLQQSGVTVNDFSSGKAIYKLTASDGSYVEYILKITANQNYNNAIPSGYYEIQSKVSGKIFSVDNGGFVNGKNIVMNSDSNLTSQAIYLSNNGDGTYTLKSYNSNRLLEKNSNNLFQNTGNNSASQKFKIINGSVTGEYYIESVLDGTIIGINSNLQYNNLTFNSKYNKTPNNIFKFNGISTLPTNGGVAQDNLGQFYKIKVKHSNFYLDMGSYYNGYKLVQYPNTNGDNQIFYFQKTDDGYYNLKAAHSGKPLDVLGYSTANFAYIGQWESNNAQNQKWIIIKDGDGYFRVISAFSEKSLDVGGFSQSPGALVIQYEYNGCDNQKFSLEASQYRSSMLSPYYEYVDLDTNKLYSFTSIVNGKVMDIQNSSLNNGARIIAGTNIYSSSQYFKVHQHPYGYFLQSTVSNKFIDVIWGSRAVWEGYHQWDYYGANSQIFRIVKDANNKYSLINLNSNMLMSLGNDGYFYQAPNYNMPSQKFNLNIR